MNGINGLALWQNIFMPKLRLTTSKSIREKTKKCILKFLYFFLYFLTVGEIRKNITNFEICGMPRAKLVGINENRFFPLGSFQQSRKDA